MTGFATFGGSAIQQGQTTTGAGDTVQVSVTNMTTSTGKAVVAYSYAGFIVSDTMATSCCKTAGKLTIRGKFGVPITYWIISL